MNIVFDLDGTLIDSAPDIQAVAGVILEGLGKPGLTIEETRNFIGEGAAVLVRKMMSARGIPFSEKLHAQIYSQFVAHYETAVDRAVFYPGVPEALARLSSDGHRLGLCTNKPEAPARAVVKYMGLERVFGAFVAGDMMPSCKPDPEMLQHCVDDLGGGPVLYVGDSEIDSQTAFRADVPFALFSRGYRKLPVSELPHDWAFDHFSQLPEIVGEAQDARAHVGRKSRDS